MMYSDYCYTGLLDTDLNVVYCDNHFLFQRLQMGSVKLRRSLSGAKPGVVVYSAFKADNVHYSAYLERLADNFVICRIYEEMPEDVEADEGIFKDIDNIKNGALSALAMARMTREYMIKSEYCRVNEYFSCNEKETSNIFSNCINILNMFERKSKTDFIQLKKWLIHTDDIISYVGGRTMKRLSFIFDIDPPYVKVDYGSLELCLYNLARLSFFCTCEGSTSFVEVSSCGGGLLNVAARIPLQQNMMLDNFRIEFRAIKHLFSNMGGHFDFYEQDGFLCGSGYVSAEFSDDVDLLPSHLTPNGSVAGIIKKRHQGKYKKLYVAHGKNVLESGVAELEDYDDEIGFARMFLMGAIADDPE